MTDVRRADPALRRRALLLLALGTVVGVILILVFEQYDAALRDWILSGRDGYAQRVNLIFVILALAIIGPLLGLAAYLASLGSAIVRAGEYPPAGMRVIRDTPIVTGERATARGRWFKVIALCCGIAAVALGWLLWRLASLLSG